jgi:hypothetical protein
MISRHTLTMFCEPGVMANPCNLSTQVATAVELRVPGQLGLTVRPCVKKQKRKRGREGRRQGEKERREKGREGAFSVDHIQVINFFG